MKQLRYWARTTGAASGRAALHAHTRPQRRLAQRQAGRFADARHRLSQPDAGGGLALPGRRRRDGRNEHQARRLRARAGPRQRRQRNLRHFAAIRAQQLGSEIELGRDLGDGAERCRLRDFDVRRHDARRQSIWSRLSSAGRSRRALPSPPAGAGAREAGLRRRSPGAKARGCRAQVPARERPAPADRVGRLHIPRATLSPPPLVTGCFANRLRRSQVARPDQRVGRRSRCALRAEHGDAARL